MQRTFEERKNERSVSHKKEPSPIIINNKENFHYKAPSSIHETVVLTLRREKDNLTNALQNQREASNSLAMKMSQMSQQMKEVEEENQRLRDMKFEDQQTIQILEERF